MEIGDQAEPLPLVPRAAFEAMMEEAVGELISLAQEQVSSDLSFEEALAGMSGRYPSYCGSLQGNVWEILDRHDELVARIIDLANTIAELPAEELTEGESDKGGEEEPTSEPLRQRVISTEPNAERYRFMWEEDFEEIVGLAISKLASQGHLSSKAEKNGLLIENVELRKVLFKARVIEADEALTGHFSLASVVSMIAYTSRGRRYFESSEMRSTAKLVVREQLEKALKVQGQK